MGNVRMGIPEELALRLKDAGNFTYLIETGTYKGGTTAWAAQNFDHVVSFEAHYPYYQRNLHLVDRFPNLVLVFGDSATELEKYFPGCPTIFWLDAHWCGSYELSRGQQECPLLAELRQVSGRVDDVILIDDARLFVNPPPRPHDPAQWPTFDQIKALLPGRYIRVVEDVIVAVPPRYQQVVDDYAGSSSDVPFVAVVTSNKYAHMIPGFALYWQLHAPDAWPVTVVRYDVRPPNIPRGWSNFAIGKQSDYSWSIGLAKYLTFCRSSHVLLLLEDYYLTRLDVGQVLRLWHLARQNSEIVKIDLSGDRAKYPHVPSQYAGLVRSEDSAPFRGSVQAAIWQTDYLLRHLLRLDADPWTWEKHACNDGALILGVEQPVIEYINACGGQGNKPGQYDRKKIPAKMQKELGLLP